MYIGFFFVFRQQECIHAVLWTAFFTSGLSPISSLPQSLLYSLPQTLGIHASVGFWSVSVWCVGCLVFIYCGGVLSPACKNHWELRCYLDLLWYLELCYAQNRYLIWLYCITDIQVPVFWSKAGKLWANVGRSSDEQRKRAWGFSWAHPRTPICSPWWAGESDRLDKHSSPGKVRGPGCNVSSDLSDQGQLHWLSSQGHHGRFTGWVRRMGCEESSN